MDSFAEKNTALADRVWQQIFIMGEVTIFKPSVLVTVIEAEVHTYLRSFLRNQPHLNWPHHLTMARLVARALRLKRPALMQTGTASGYCFSYLTPALLFACPVIVVVPKSKQKQLLDSAIPQLKEWLDTNTPVKVCDHLETFSPQTLQDHSGIILVSPQDWLADRLFQKGCLPSDLPTIFDEADDLENWAREQLTLRFATRDWNELLNDYPQQAEVIRDVRVELTKMLFNRPQNPYECLLLNQPEQDILKKLFLVLSEVAPHHHFCQFFQQAQAPNQLLWADIHREKGQFTLACCPVSVAETLKGIWEQQPTVFIGGFLDWEKEAPVYRQKLGLGEMTCLKFSRDHHHEEINLYIPDGLPMPNTRKFQPALMEQLRHLLSEGNVSHNFMVILVNDVPLKRQIASTLAGEFGSRVRLESTEVRDNGILVCSWEFWREHQNQLATPQLLIMTTIPLPSLENPLVGGQVAYYKQKRQDWFRLYLLPTALKELQRAVVPLRNTEGMVALLDSRVNHRSYGKTVLSALEPYARVGNWNLVRQLLRFDCYDSIGVEDDF
jgi:ATP-dependent DNA helicase DinG